MAKTLVFCHKKTVFEKIAEKKTLKQMLKQVQHDVVQGDVLDVQSDVVKGDEKKKPLGKMMQGDLAPE